MYTAGKLRSVMITLAAVTMIAGAADAKLTNHTIVLGKSIGAVSIGMTRAQAERLLGAGVLAGGNGTRVEFWEKLGLAAFFNGTTKAATTVGAEATSTYFRTPRDIHVGDRTAQVLSAYAGMTCHPADAPTPTNPDKYCTRHGPAHRATIFYFGGNGALDRIVVSVA